jgi:DNA-binding transcriptional regulator YdaS (Cro superfamily)
MALLRPDSVRQVILREVQKAGSQLGWAKRIGARSTDVNNVLRGRRLPVQTLLDAAGALTKVPAYALTKASRSPQLLRTSQVLDLMEVQIRRAGSQSAWAREIGAKQSDINNALRGRRLPVKAILHALELEKVAAYEIPSDD